MFPKFWSDFYLLLQTLQRKRIDELSDFWVDKFLFHELVDSDLPRNI